MIQFKCKVPDGVSGDWRVETFTVSKADSDFTKIRAAIHPDEFVEAGTYKRLMRGLTVVMSNTRFEVDTNSSIIHHAKGTVLINGLGLGLVVSELLKKEAVQHITVIEQSPDVIKLVAPSFAGNPRVTIIEGDALEHTPKKGERWDYVWHDIWDFICSDNLAAMRQLKRKYARRTGWQNCWGYYQCLRQRF